MNGVAATILVAALTLGSPQIPTMEEAFASEREGMVREQLLPRGISHPGVLAAMGRVPRHAFVPEALRSQAYGDHPLPIGLGQTISQPFIVAFMTQALEPRPSDRVLEIGTGSGYQAAVLSTLVAQVYSMELLEPLARRAEGDLRRLGFRNVRVRCGDGYKGWPEEAPFDTIIVTCAPEQVPQPLIDQLKEGGRMIIPVGIREQQQLVLLHKRDGQLLRRAVLPVRFVPMVPGG
ncbi:MAG: protein-L-isoaspartate(D-aspartate) O-methyltransferase [Acidobacteria bacterium]|nr:protein-L-isoaspartate(D-aspartate) O-methyltransferase [Acidobacteriota bacterium]